MRNIREEVESWVSWMWRVVWGERRSGMAMCVGWRDGGAREESWSV